MHIFPFEIRTNCYRRIYTFVSLSKMEGVISEMHQHYFVDCSQNEMKDIQSALIELLTTYKKNNNKKRHIFRIKKFEMCGSMAEETRTWCFDGQQS